MGSPFPGPTPAYSNPPIEPQYYSPRFRFIDSITRGNPTTVVTTEDNEFVIGSLVRFVLPIANGIRQLNNQTGYVVEIDSTTQFLVAIDSTNYDPFVSTSDIDQPQVVPVGDINNGVTNTSNTNQATYIPGSFINISPN